MKRHLLKFVRAAIVAGLFASPVAAVTSSPDPTAPQRTLKAFSGEPELARRMTNNLAPFCDGAS